MFIDYVEVLERRQREAERAEARKRIARGVIEYLMAPFHRIGVMLAGLFDGLTSMDSPGSDGADLRPFDWDWSSFSFESWESPTGDDDAMGRSIGHEHEIEQYTPGEGASINPATGLYMGGGLDSGGNPYGCPMDWSETSTDPFDESHSSSSNLPDVSWDHYDF